MSCSFLISDIEEMARVEVKCSSVVKMGGNESRISRLDLTPFDKGLLHFNYLQRGLIFQNPMPNNNITQILQHLKNSLSLSLQFFPPLAGRLAASYSSIDCNNAGVDFTHAVAAAVSVSDILEPKYKPEILYSLFPLNGILNYQGVSNPLLAVQLTELADGLFLAFASNHAVVDGTSFWHFINSWSEISRGSITISKPPIFERCFPAAKKPSEQREAIVKPPIPVPVPVVNRVFHFSRECLIRLKAKANSEAGTDKISTLQSLSAHLWRCKMRCGRRRTEEEEAAFAIMVGARGRNPNLPDGYFGNAIDCACFTMSAAELLQKGLGNAALKINDEIARKAKEVAAADFMEAGWKERGRVLPFIMGGSARHDVYGNDFGWGKPVAVRGGIGPQLDGIACISPAADGGIDVDLCSEEETFRAMEDDAEFTQAFSI